MKMPSIRKMVASATVGTVGGVAGHFLYHYTNPKAKTISDAKMDCCLLQWGIIKNLSEGDKLRNDLVEAAYHGPAEAAERGSPGGRGSFSGM